MDLTDLIIDHEFDEQTDRILHEVLWDGIRYYQILDNFTIREDL